MRIKRAQQKVFYWFVCGLTILCFPLIIGLAHAGDDCECEKPKCGACFQQEGISFYTAKCAGGTKVKSCAKPACVPLDPLPPNCVAEMKAMKKNSPVASEPKVITRPREIASLPKSDVGVVKVLKGSAWLKESDGSKHQLKVGERVYEGAKIITDKGSGLLVSFDDGNEIHVSPSSELHLKKIDTTKSNDKKALIDLIKGKVRSKVKAKYKGASSFYRVRTKAAVAGVRGTDFVVSYSDNDRLVMKVETLKGEVELFDHSREQKVSVPAGTYSSYVVAANDSKVFSDEEISEFIAKGYMTPVYKMTAEQIKTLAQATDMAQPDRSVVATHQPKSEPHDYICSHPRAQLNACAWTCQNNPKGSTYCQTQLPEVHCIRRRCNANGEWAEPTRVPASYHQACDPEKTRIAPCDY